MSTETKVDASSADNSRMRKLAAASILATSLEWFDFLIYSTAAALVLGDLFFPELDGAGGILAAFATFAIGFLARPIGGIIAGHVGDRVGRKPPLVGSMIIMGVATFAIGLLPTYAQIGVWAPILLVSARLLQGLGVGAQWGGAALLLTEHAPVAKRGFYGSLIQTGAVIGSVAGTAVFLILTSVLSDSAFESWGWRVPFIIGLALVGIGAYVQLKIEDTPVFEALRLESAKQTSEIRKTPIVTAIQEYWREILQAAGAFFVVNATFYILISGLLNYGTAYAGMSRSSILACVLIASATEIFTIPMFGALSDRYSRRKLFLAATVAMAIFAFPLFWLVNTGSVPIVLPTLIVAFTIHAMLYGIQPAMYAEMFPADVRFSGASLGYQVASVLAGGFAPLIMTALLAATGASWSVSLYIIGMAVITFISVYLIKEHYQRDLYEVSTKVRPVKNAESVNSMDSKD